MEKSKKYLLGIDLGASAVKFVLFDRKHHSLIRGELSTPQVKKAEILIETLWSELTKKVFRCWPLTQIASIGIGVAGDVDSHNGILRFSPNTGWQDFPLLKIIGHYFSGPVFLDNDANAAAWGAYWFDYEGRVKNLVCVTLGTGIGGGLVLNGKIYRGESGSAGEIGHLSLHPGGRLCSCGNKGCLEAYIGTPAVVNYTRVLLKKEKTERNAVSPSLLHSHWPKVTPEFISQSAGRGDKLAQKVWNYFGEQLGIVLAGIVNLLNPEAIVLTGGVAQASPYFLPTLRKTISAGSFVAPRQILDLRVSRYPQDLGVYGAALLESSFPSR